MTFFFGIAKVQKISFLFFITYEILTNYIKINRFYAQRAEKPILLQQYKKFSLLSKYK